MKSFSLLCSLLLGFLLLFTACRDKTATPVEAAVDQPLPAHLLSHTQGTISRDAPLEVLLNTAPASAPEVSFVISPRTPGKLSMDGRRIRFRPDAPWVGGVTYTVRVEVEDEPDYTFTFSVPERQLAVMTEGIYIPDPERPQAVEITGIVRTNDGATVEEIARVLRVTHGGRELPVTVEPGPNRNTLRFVARLADRGEGASTVTVATNPGAGGFAGAASSTEVAIGARGTLALQSVAVTEARDAIELRFSNPVDAGQDLRGLVSFEDGLRYTTATDANIVRIYPSGDNLGAVKLRVSGRLRGADGGELGADSSWELQLGETRPGLRTVSAGTIVPHRGRRLFTFEAVGLEEVYLEIFQIYANNAPAFLLEGGLEMTGDEWSNRRFGKIVHREIVSLDGLAGAPANGRWTRYAIDLDEFLGNDASAIYQLRLGFGMEQTTRQCNRGLADFGLERLDDRLADRDDFNPGFADPKSLLGDYYGLYGYYDNFNWEDRNDPCLPGYYNQERFLIQNVVSSNLGLIAKRNPDRSTLAFVTDLLTAGPVTGATVVAYSYARQEIYRGTSDGNGRVAMTTTEEPAAIVATKNGDVVYLKIADDPGLSISRFDVGGSSAAGGIKGAFFAERGVWRPGDSVFLNFVLQDRQQRLPDNYPVRFTLTDARGKRVMTRTVQPAFGGGLYDLTFRTAADDATGTWSATVEAGGQTYTQSLLVETVKPNRLAISLTPPTGGLGADRRGLELTASWLYGAPGAGLRAEVTASPVARTPEFADFIDYVFHDPARQLSTTEPVEVFDGTLSTEGRTTFQLPAPGDRLPGPLSLRLATRVYEPGGDFSIDNQRLPFDPYTIYAGVRIPQDQWGGKSIAREGKTSVAVSAVNPAGEGVANRRLTVGIYRVDWRYWWQDNNDNVARFGTGEHVQAIETLTTTTGTDGRASVPVGITEWGRYLLRVCDGGGHCTGDYFYAGYGEAAGEDRESAALLRLKPERETVARGERVAIRVPTSAGGNLLVSLETGVGTIEQFWVPTRAGETEITFTADERMVPTVYANVSYLQPYAQTTNDRPVRLFGVAPVTVESPETRLEPTLAVADEWQPEQTVDVTVAEAGGRPMTYTLAVVDEGLLGLTRFATPDLHGKLYAKEALGVRTYDVYAHVMSSINGEFGRVLAIGGDEGILETQEAAANRFPPVVRHLGPFRLRSGQRTHRITLPNYVGAVRVMVVAAGDGAYGSAEARVPVRQPLMVLPTLPRVLGPGETVEMPVTVFAMDERVRRVNVGVSEAAGLAAVGSAAQTVNFSAVGDRLTYFPVSVGEAEGVARFAVNAEGNGERGGQEIEIAVRHPNVTVDRSQLVALSPGERRRITYENFGLPGTRAATVELSALPAMHLNRHLRHLLRYPYGCAEQTVSPAFAQVFLDRVMELDREQETQRRRNVAAGIDALRKFTTAGGGLAYWPGGNDPHPWASNYGLHFLLEAERAGFTVPYGLREELVGFAERAATGWTKTGGQFYASLRQRTLDQAYRLYVLALADRAEVGAMNRLRSLRGELDATARYQLAAAYALIGRQTTAAELMSGDLVNPRPYRELGYTFGSEIRDMAIILEAQLAAGEPEAAARQTLRLAEAVRDRNYLSTQEAAFAFVALGKLNSAVDNPLRAEFTTPGGRALPVGATTGVYAIELPVTAASASYELHNTGASPLYVSTTVSGKPRPGEEEAVSNQLRLQVSYVDDAGKAVDVGRLRSGTRFIARYQVTNPGTTARVYRQLALQTLLPSGWEVANERLAGADDGGGYDYRDIRDDRVHTFFDLSPGETKTFAFRMTATYPGRFYLPTQVSEAMYDPSIRSEVKGRWVEVLR